MWCLFPASSASSSWGDPLDAGWQQTTRHVSGGSGQSAGGVRLGALQLCAWGQWVKACQSPRKPDEVMAAVTVQPLQVLSSSSLVCAAGGVCVLRVSRWAVPLAPPKPGAGTAALQRGAALGRHGDPTVSVTAQEGPAAPQVHQDRSAVSLRGGFCFREKLWTPAAEQMVLWNEHLFLKE